MIRSTVPSVYNVRADRAPPTEHSHEARSMNRHVTDRDNCDDESRTDSSADGAAKMAKVTVFWA